MARGLQANPGLMPTAAALMCRSPQTSDLPLLGQHTCSLVWLCSFCSVVVQCVWALKQVLYGFPSSTSSRVKILEMLVLRVLLECFFSKNKGSRGSEA